MPRRSQRAAQSRTGGFPLPDWASPDMYAFHALRTCPDLHFYRHVYANTHTSAYTCLIAYTAMKRATISLLSVSSARSSVNWSHAATLRHPAKCPVYPPDARNVSRDQHRKSYGSTSACPMHTVPRHHHRYPRHAVRCPATHARGQMDTANTASVSPTLGIH